MSITATQDILAKYYRKFFSAWETELRSENKDGSNDTAKASEAIAQEILNVLYGYQLEQEPISNSPGFDLCCMNNQIMVQITSKLDLRKITECLRTTRNRVAKEPQLKDFELYILFLTLDRYKVNSLRQKISAIIKHDELGFDISDFTFFPSTHILDLKTLLDRIGNYTLSKQQMTRLETVLEKYSTRMDFGSGPEDRVREVIGQYADNFTAPLFMHPADSTVTLQNMYIEPDFRDQDHPSRNIRSIPALLQDFLWEQQKEQILLLEGDAAIGKTSLVSWMCRHHTHPEEAQALGSRMFRNLPLVCVRLRELEFQTNEETAAPILRYLNIPSAGAFVRRYSGALIVLDGADELGMVSNLSAESIARFILNVRKELGAAKLIVTTRPPFLSAEHLYSRLFKTRKVILNHFDQHSRNLWLQKYLAQGETVPYHTRSYIEHLKDEEADGVADTPLALYLLVHCDIQDEFRNNLWALYHEIFAKAIPETYYTSAVLGAAPILSQEQARQNYSMVKEIAFRMFRNSGYDRYHITMEELDEAALACGLAEVDAAFIKRTCVLCAYWKNTETGALEFYHNNIRDFFLCEYICDKLTAALRQLPTDLGNVPISAEHPIPFLNTTFQDARWTPLIEECCRIFSWIKIVGSTWHQVFTFICLRLQSEARNPQDRGTLLYQLLKDPVRLQFPEALLAHNTMWSLPYSNHPYFVVKVIVANILTLWHIFMEFAPGQHWISLPYEGKTLLRDWISLFSERTGIRPVGYVSLLGKTDIFDVNWSDMTLKQLDCSDSRLANVNFENTTVTGAFFTRCQMDEVKFEAAHLQGCIFSNSGDEDSSYQYAIIQACTFSNATLQKSNFSYANFRMTQFDGVHFIGCDFLGTVFSELQGYNMVFQNCQFNEAHLTRLKLESIIFRSPVFTGAVFEHTELKYCHIEGPGTDLYDTTFNHVQTQGCTFRNVPPDAADRLRAIGFTEA